MACFSYIICRSVRSDAHVPQSWFPRGLLRSAKFHVLPKFPPFHRVSLSAIVTLVDSVALR